jgi:broad specificity phosphatase PhoE
MRLYLIRHGQTAWNVEGRAQGHADVGLDDEGRRQSRLLGRAFREVALARVVSSDLSRALETARAVAEATGAPLTTDSRLREQCFGEWEGRLYSDWRAEIEIHATNSGQLPADFAPPGGESIRQVWERTGDFVASLHPAGGDVAIVSHGGAAGLLLARLCGEPLEAGRTYRFPNASVTLLSRAGGGWELVRFGDVEHLQGERSEA